MWQDYQILHHGGVVSQGCSMVWHGGEVRGVHAVVVWLKC